MLQGCSTDDIQQIQHNLLLLLLFLCVVARFVFISARFQFKLNKNNPSKYKRTILVNLW